MSQQALVERQKTGPLLSDGINGAVSFKPGGSLRGSVEALSQGSKQLGRDNFLKALQIRIESAMFDSSEFRYFIAVTLEDGIKVPDSVSFYRINFLVLEKEKNRYFREGLKPYIQC